MKSANDDIYILDHEILVLKGSKSQVRHIFLTSFSRVHINYKFAIFYANLKALKNF